MIFLKNWKVKMMLFNLRMTLVFYVIHYIIIDFGSIFFYKNEVLTTEKVADILVFKLTGILVLMSS